MILRSSYIIICDGLIRDGKIEVRLPGGHPDAMPERQNPRQ